MTAFIRSIRTLVSTVWITDFGEDLLDKSQELRVPVAEQIARTE
ncbi:hypothetical protein [Nonomuraea sp. NPDC003709]